MVETSKLLGQLINERYRILDFIGKGGSGRVFKADDVETGRVVALKVLKDGAADDPESVIRFEKEVAVSAHLRNPHSTRVYEFGKTSEGYLVIAMEFLDGRILGDLIKEEAPMPAYQVVDFVCQALEALAEAHERGIVHRDLKPDNMFIVKDEAGNDHLKVLDFGIAKFLREDTVGDTLTRDGFVFGTPLYISPEQALGWQVTAASDVYSLGVVFFEMLTGFPPFEAETPMGLGMKHIYEPPPLEKLKPLSRVGVEVKNVLGLMLEKRPERRPSDAAKARALLEKVVLEPDTPIFEVECRGQDRPAHPTELANATVRARPVPTPESDRISIVDEELVPLEVAPVDTVSGVDTVKSRKIIPPAPHEGEIPESPPPLPVQEPPAQDGEPSSEQPVTKEEIPPEGEDSSEISSELQESPIAPVEKEDSVEIPLFDEEEVPAPIRQSADRVESTDKFAAAPQDLPSAVAATQGDAFSLFASTQSRETFEYETSELLEDAASQERNSAAGRTKIPMVAWIFLFLGFLLVAFVLYVLLTAPPQTPTEPASSAVSLCLPHVNALE